MSADFYAPHEALRPAYLSEADPYNSKTVRVRHGSKSFRIATNGGRGAEEVLDFNPEANYVLEALLERQQILVEFERIRELGVLPSARWKSRDYFHRPTGSQIHQTKLIVDTATVSEHVVVSVHPNQHLIDEGRERLMKAAERMATDSPDSPATKRGIAYLMEILNRPVTLASLSEPL